MSFIYLASPYSGTKEEMQSRFEAIEAHTAGYLRRGVNVFSPIVHCHVLAQKYNLPTDALFWQKYNAAMLRHARSLEVLCIVGWRESEGVTWEVKIAKKFHIPVMYHRVPA